MQRNTETEIESGVSEWTLRGTWALRGLPDPMAGFDFGIIHEGGFPTMEIYVTAPSHPEVHG